MASSKYRIALVEDDESLGYVLSEYLRINDFDITWLKSGRELLDLLDNHMFDLLILDVTLPDTSGFELAISIKSKFPRLPFIFLTARSMKIDVLKGFAAGAVDYLKKPIDEEELVAKIKALLDRIVVTESHSDNQNKIGIGLYTFDPQIQVLEHQGEKIRLTERESSLLFLLSSRVNELCSHNDILLSLWGKNDYFNKKSLNVFISHLRKYLAKDPNIKIENIRNRGFTLSVNEY